MQMQALCRLRDQKTGPGWLLISPVLFENSSGTILELETARVAPSGSHLSIPQHVTINGLYIIFFAIYCDYSSMEFAMKIDKQMSAEAMLAELGQRLARRRIDLGLTQAQAAEEAGLGKRTLERLEAGSDTKVATLIRILSVLDLTEELNRLVPEPGLRPMDLLKLKGKERKYAYSPRSDHQPEIDWKWGDKQ
jgi:transcriptional regulator with XRE-family HTH domain